MSGLINLYDLKTNEFQGKLTLSNSMEMRYYYFNSCNKEIGYAIILKNKLIIRSNRHEDLFMGSFEQNKIQFLNKDGNYFLYGIKTN